MGQLDRRAAWAWPVPWNELVYRALEWSVTTGVMEVYTSNPSGSTSNAIRELARRSEVPVYKGEYPAR
jgi:hypothetical protein